MRKSAPDKVREPATRRKKKVDPLDGLDIFNADDAMTIARILGSEYVDVEMPFDLGNVYEPMAPFTTVPAWLRPFMFRVLKIKRDFCLFVHFNLRSEARYRGGVAAGDAA